MPLQNDANLITTNQTTPWLDGTMHPGLQTPLCSGDHRAAAPRFDSHFTSSKPFSINDYIKPTDATCAPTNKFAALGVQKGDPQGLPGGCTRDIVHRFYQEQYQLDHGKQDRYSTGSDAVGLTQGHYDTKQLPVYEYLHKKKAPALRDRRPLVPGGVRRLVPQPPVAHRGRSRRSGTPARARCPRARTAFSTRPDSRTPATRSTSR